MIQKPQKQQQPTKGPLPKRSTDGQLHGADLVFERAFFYRDGFRNLLYILGVNAVLTLGLFIFCIFLWKAYTSKEREYFAMAPNGTVIKMVPFSSPTITESRMLQIVADSATCVFTFDYKNYREQMGLCSKNFTEDGWTKFTKELTNSKLIDFATQGGLILSATRIKSPVVVDKGVFDGVLAWKVQVPIRVTFSSRGGDKTEDYLVSMTVSRASQLEYSDGVAISNFIQNKIN